MEPNERLNALDATFLELEEADDSAHMHIGAVMLLEPSPAGDAPKIDHVRDEIAARLDPLPRYRQKLSESRTGGLRWPTWDPDPGFDIAHHVYRAGLPAPAGVEQLRDWAGDYFSIRLDRHRPLWELVVVELADGRWALVSKTHHCLVDGVGSVDAAKVLLDTEPEPEPRPAPEPDPGEHDQAGNGSGRGANSSSFTDRLDPRALAGASLRTVGRVLGAAGNAVHLAAATMERAADPHRLSEVLRKSEALAEVLVRDELIAAPTSTINGPIGAHRHLAVVDVPLDRLKQIRSGLGGTVNDAVLAAAAGGLRGLLLERGEEPPLQGLRAMIPVNIRPAADRLALGNRITSLFVHVPVAEEQPLDRYKAQLEETEGLKAGNQATGSRVMIDLASMAPPALHSFIARSLFATRLFNLTITNVPGPQQPLFALGSRVTEIWPLVPLAAEHAIGLAVLSYDGSVFFCLNADRDSVPDLEVLRSGIEAEVELLSGLATERGPEDPARSPSAA